MASKVGHVGVVGLGTMGAGIAEVFARSGRTVTAIDRDDAAVAIGRGHVEKSTGRAVSRGKLSAAEQSELIGRISFSADLAKLAAADLVIEAVPERLALKRPIFTALDDLLGPDAIMATNTSSLSVTEIATATSRPDRVIGVHFFNPAPVMKLVEIVRGVSTDPDVVSDVQAVVADLGKTGVVIADRAGFIANALLFGYLNHAMAMYESGYASAEDIDAAMKLGRGLPMGPMTLLDLIGLDTSAQILTTMYRQSRNRLHAPAPILTELITAGRLGRKTGHGFYRYDQPAAEADTGPPAEAVDGGLIRTVALVGDGPTASALAALSTKAGLTVQSVPATVGESSELHRAGDADIVVVAGPDDPDQLRQLFAQLGPIAKPGAVLALGSAAVPVIDCAAASRRPADVLGLHVVNPARDVAVIEIVRTIETSARSDAAATRFVQQLGPHPVRCRDRAGFIADALWFGYLNDAVRMVESGYASTDDVDTAMTLGCGFPAGPFAELDQLGLDVVLAGVRRLYREQCEPGLAPAPLLEQLVTAGRLGIKTGRGFRDHT